MATIMDMTNDKTVTTTTENAADFGFLAPSSLLTLTLHHDYHKFMTKLSKQEGIFPNIMFNTK